MWLSKEQFYDELRKLDDNQFPVVWEMICMNASNCKGDTEKCLLCNAPHDLMARKLEKHGCACFGACCGVCCGYCKSMYNGECDDYHEHCLDCDKWNDGNCPVYLEHKEMFSK